MGKIGECNLQQGGQHFWLPAENESGKGMPCYSCPMCEQKIYWSPTLQNWVNVTKYSPKYPPKKDEE